jgi:uncharacterized membrane protein
MLYTGNTHSSMDILVYNLGWMTYNLYLAILPVIFSWFLFRMPNKFFTAVVGILWFLYLPNTVYIFTDLHHLIEQWDFVVGFEKIVLIFQYIVLEVIGLSCFLIAFYPFERIFQKFHLSKKQTLFTLIGINFLIGFALVLGKIERVNSWDVFLNPAFVIFSAVNLIVSYKLLFLSLLFGFFANCFYFLFRKQAKKLYSQWASS